MTVHVGHPKTRQALAGLAIVLQLGQPACSGAVPSEDVSRTHQEYTHTSTRFSWGENTIGSLDDIACAAIKRGDPPAQGDIAITFYHDNEPGECLTSEAWLNNAETQTGIGDGGAWNVVTGPGSLSGDKGEPMVRLKEGTNGGIGFYLSNGPPRWVSDSYFEASEHMEISIKHMVIDEYPIMKPFTNTDRTMRLSYKNQVETVRHSTAFADNNMKLDYRVTLRSCSGGSIDDCDCDASNGTCRVTFGLFSYFRQDSSGVTSGDAKIEWIQNPNSMLWTPKISYLPSSQGNPIRVYGEGYGEDNIVGMSNGQSVKSAAYSPRTFEIAVTWKEFETLLRAAARRHNNSTIAEMFGSAWYVRNSWLVMTPRLVVEGRNNNEDSARHWIGGSFSWAKIEAE